MSVKTGNDDGATARIINRRIDEPAPFLAILHDIQAGLGYLPESALSQVADALHIPLSELYGTVTFYHYFQLDAPDGPPPLRMCGSVACDLKGLGELERELIRSSFPKPHSGKVERISCPGRCDIAVPVFLDGQVFAHALPGRTGELKPAPSPLPHETSLEECVFAGIRSVDPSIRDYLDRGGYGTLRAVASDPGRAIETLKESGLTGRGGAGFPTWAKWDAVRRESASEKFIICNADEGEPACFKDRVLLDHDPHAALEGMITAGLVTGSQIGIVYLRYEYPETLLTLERAIEEVFDQGFLGDDVAGSGRAFRIVIRRGGGAYICGEETSLLNSLEGKHPFPRERPPYPTSQGLFGKPTVINNVETFATVSPILRKGGQWYRNLGRGENAGTRIYSVSGDIARSGNYEMPVGTPLAELLNTYAGGVPEGRELKAATMGGISGGFLGGDDLNVPLDAPSVQKVGGMLGAGGIIVYDDSRCVVRAARACMQFYAHESCGKCFPCRIGTTRATEVLTELMEGRVRPRVAEELEDLNRVMAEASACGLGLAAPSVVRSMVKYWPEEFRAHLEGSCPTGECKRS